LANTSKATLGNTLGIDLIEQGLAGCGLGGAHSSHRYMGTGLRIASTHTPVCLLLLLLLLLLPPLVSGSTCSNTCSVALVVR
jgi:hypothetical protein